ncbi:MAG: type II toxin-antitoxin system HicB family antitoxin [Eubacterium sp.]|nr:type II toxin-antitoxin system HicB family antitoxin [Eubacterium sp.]
MKLESMARNRDYEVAMKKRINITLEDDVVKRVDYYADAHYTSRSGAITMLIVDATDDYKVTATKKAKKPERTK